MWKGGCSGASFRISIKQNRLVFGEYGSVLVHCCIHTGKCDIHWLLIGLLRYACANMVDNFPAKPAENFASACGVLGCFLRTHFPNMRMIVGEVWLGWRLILRIAFLDLALDGQVKIWFMMDRCITARCEYNKNKSTTITYQISKNSILSAWINDDN